jgi:PLP dependent protein
MFEKLGPVPKEIIAENLARVQARMAEAASKVNRQAGSIRLVAVTKYVGIAEVLVLVELGVRDIGESRIQEVEAKEKELTAAGATERLKEIHLHLIGHLQTNKADKAAKLFQSIHSIDSERVAAAIHKERAKLALPPLPVLLEVNVAGEANKYGLPPEAKALGEILKRSAEWNLLTVEGLMCMAPLAEGNAEAVSRPVFRRLRELRDELASSSGRALPELSMGMTQDYTVAIEEGATLVRVGSALFEKQKRAP